MKKILVVLLLGCLFISCKPSNTIKYLKSVNNETARQWIEFISDYGIDAITSSDETLLWVAVSQNNTELVKACLKDDANPNIYPSGRVPALNLSIRNRNLELCELLLKNGAKINPDYGEGSPMDETEFFFWGTKNKGYSTDFDDLLIKYYKKQKISDLTNVNTCILREDSSPMRVAKFSNEGFKFSFYDMTVIAMEYINSFGDEVAQKAYMNALKNNCNFKKYKNSAPFANEFLVFLKHYANAIYAYENIDFVITQKSEEDWYSKYSYEFSYTNPIPLFADIYEGKSRYGETLPHKIGNDVVCVELGENAEELVDINFYDGNFYDEKNSKLNKVLYMENYFISFFSGIYDVDFDWNKRSGFETQEESINQATKEINSLKAELENFYSDEDVKTQKESFLTMINFLTEQGL